MKNKFSLFLANSFGWFKDNNSSKKIIVAENKKHLKELIFKEIDKNGLQCDLNHIDVSHITDMSDLFSMSLFSGDISKWNVSNVTNMNSMFWQSQFNSDVSQWDVSNVTDMRKMFWGSTFDGDLSKWNVSKVMNTFGMFFHSEFKGDTSDWPCYNLYITEDMFDGCKAPIPYWFEFENSQDRLKAVEKHQSILTLTKQINDELSINKKSVKDKKLKL